MNNIEKLISDTRRDYNCFNLLREYYNSNPNFKEFIDTGIKNNKIFMFDESFWEKIENQNFRYPGNFIDYFKNGSNLGRCTIFSKQISYSFNTCLLCSGIVPILKGSINCEEGAHCWMESDGYVYDTTFMIKVNRDYYYNLVSKVESKKDPNLDPIYASSKEFTNDENLRRR